MLSEITLPKKKTAEAAFDNQQLYAIGLEHVQRLASRIWTDYNLHDPGITILELLCYALTDLSYRASFPIEDLLASEHNNVVNMKEQFFTTRRILPNRPLTVSDYRKLLIGELKVVKNAWLRPAALSYYVNTFDESDPTKRLSDDKSDLLGIITVPIGGLYEVIIEYMDDTPEDAKQKVLEQVKQLLQANRNLCEDFVNYTEVGTQLFFLGAELELTPIANEVKVKAEILSQVQHYLTPPVNCYTLSEMLERKQADGTSYTADKIFEGPALYGGFIDDHELAQANLREEIRLSDIISIIMDIEDVQAVRDIVISPQDTQTPLENKWVVPVTPGSKARLNESRLVFYKRNVPVVIKEEAETNVRAKAATAKVETGVVYDFDIPLGQYRQPGNYYSFQNHFPVVYRLSEEGLSDAADDRRKALAYQLKAYLLFFDQVMANYFAQLSHVKDLFSTDPDLQCTYFYQMVDSFTDYNKIYSPVCDISSLQDDMSIDRRNRFLDHLIARFAERFHDIAYTMYSIFVSKPENMFSYKCDFLKDYPVISSERSLAYNYSLKNDNDLWNTENVSGLEKRLSRLLGISNYKRRNLSDSDEGMYLIENILLRPEQKDDPFLPVCLDPKCADCAEVDPYSYRIHIILPAYSSRFSNMDFRRFAEEVIREETPAHILPKICWISKEDMVELEIRYHDWIYLKAGKDTDTAQRTKKLTNFIDTLFRVKNVYPSHNLDESEFILGQTALGQ
jgi:hypothetical protein